jgi:hypothetical protein
VKETGVHVFKQNDIIIFVPVQKDPVDSGTAEYAFVVKPKSNSTGMEIYKSKCMVSCDTDIS